MICDDSVSDGCCLIVRAFERGERFAEPFPDAATIASGLRVPAAVGDFMILDAVRESGGLAVAVEEARLREWLRLAQTLEGIAVCPEAAACVGALEKLSASGWIGPQDHVVLFNTGAAQKYLEAITAELPRIRLGGVRLTAHCPSARFYKQGRIGAGARLCQNSIGLKGLR